MMKKFNYKNSAMNNLKLSLVLLLLTSLLSSGQQQENPPVVAEKISDNIYQLTGGRGANAGMYIGPDEVLIIDAKMDKASVDGIFAAVRNLTDKPVRYLINTHSDGDHVNGNEFFPKNVIIISHENCRKEFFHPGRDGSPSRWNDKSLRAFIPQVTFNDRMDLHLGNQTVELHYFGVGHTTGDIVVYFPEEKIAFIGDQVFFGRPQLIHSYKGGNSFEHIKTVERMMETLPAEKFCSGHAEIKGRKDIETHLKEMKAFQQKVNNMVKEGKNLQEIQATFEPAESRLVESVFNEVKGK